MSNNVIYDFKLMGDEYNPVVMWYWMDITTKKEIEFQLGEFKKMGIYEYFIHPMFGLRDDYLEDEFMELIAFAIEVTKKLGMKFWIYDEYNWPSGTAGGKLLERYPWARGKILRRYQLAVGSTQPVSHVANGVFYKAFVENIDDGSVHFVDVTKEIKVETDGITTKATYLNKSINVTVLDFYFIEYQDTLLASAHWANGLHEVPGYIDTFNPKAVRKYIELTHERYKKYIGKEFGTTVRGVFTDETTMCAVGDIIKSGAVVFNDCTEKEFKKRYGYDLGAQINWLYFPPVTEEHRKVRNDFWNLVTDLYLENFIKQMSDWCVENNLMFTGHFGGEEHLQWSLMETGDMQKALTLLHRPGMDSIASSVKINDTNFNNAGKMVSSVAKLCERDRILCEAYTCSGWDTHFDLLKRIANRIITMGGNFIQYMGAYYSLNGNRKEQPMGYPPSHSYNNPLAKYYKIFSDYIGAAQYVSAKTHPAGKVAVIAPLTHIKQGIDLAHFPTSADTEANRTDILYENLVNALLELHVEFDIISEFMLKDFKKADGKAVIGKYEYDTVIFPAVKNYDEKIADFANMLYDTDVLQIFINGFLENKIDCKKALPDAAKLVKQGSNAEGAELYKYEGKDIYEIIKEGATVSDLVSELKALVGDHNVLNFKAEDGKVYTALRENDDTTVLFIDNDDDKSVKVSFDLLPEMRIISPLTKEDRPFTVNGGRAELVLNNFELVMVISEKNGAINAVTTDNGADLWNVYDKAADREISLESFDFKADNNVFICPFEYKFKKNDFGYKKAVNFTMFEGRDFICCGDKYAARSTFTLNGYKGRIELFTELECIKKATLNGKKLKLKENYRLWGPENCLLDISDYVKEGENELILECVIPDYNAFHTIPNTMIFGDFALGENDELIPFEAEKITYGDFSVQGLKYCTGDARYSYTFEALPCKKAFVSVETDDAFTVYLNGKEIAKRLWKPGVAELIGLKDGVNELVIETTSPYGNLMRQKTVNGILAPVKIKFFD